MRSAAILIPLTLLAAAPLAAAEVVSVPAFRSVELRGGGDVVFRPGPVQRVTIVSGSSQFTSFRMKNHGQLEIDACNDRCPRHYDLQIEIQSPHVPTVAIEGGGKMVAAPGFAPQRELTAAIDGGGIIDMRALAATNVTAAVNGGGKILSGRSANLTAAVRGGGEIRYAGNPDVTQVIDGGGSIRRLD